MVVKYTAAFLIGFLSCAIIFGAFLLNQETEVPIATGFAIASLDAPSDKISERDIVVLEDMIILKIKNGTLSTYAPTGSMKPLFDEGANGIRIVPESSNDIEIGDIVSYRNENGNLIVHRVVARGVDDNGLYFITRGDNNTVLDEKVRFEDIEYLTVGVIW